MISIAAAEKIPEIYLQKLIRRLLVAPGMTRNTVAGESIQLLSVGEWNLDKGPDFLRIALMRNADVETGDAEFHRRSSDWLAHGHHKDPAYDRVILHIVLDNDCQQVFGQSTLVIPLEELSTALQEDRRELQSLHKEERSDVSASMKLQEYALRRLERKSAAALELAENIGMEAAIIELTQSFLDRHSVRKRRPRGIRASAEAIMARLGGSAIVDFLRQMLAGAIDDFPSALDHLAETRVAGEGKASRIEILINALLPLALGLASREQRVGLLLWFWSLPSMHQYGSLKRKFAQIDQDTVWQQQGLLEYYYECRNGRDRVAELLIPYNVRRKIESIQL